MKKTVLILVALIMTVWATAQSQTQIGYVKTKGRLAKDGSIIAGKPIPNVSIILRGGNSTVSESDGSFSILVPNGTFYLQSVKKQGFVLTDPEVLSKEYTYSKNKMVIVMEDLEQQQAELRALEREISSRFYSELQKRAKDLDSLKEQNKIDYRGKVPCTTAKTQSRPRQQRKTHQIHGGSLFENRLRPS